VSPVQATQTRDRPIEWMGLALHGARIVAIVHGQSDMSMIPKDKRTWSTVWEVSPDETFREFIARVGKSWGHLERTSVELRITVPDKLETVRT